MTQQNYLEHIVGEIGEYASGYPGVPLYHAAFSSIGLKDWHYSAFPIERRNLGNAIQGLRALKTIRGFVCAAALQSKVMKYCDVIEDNARLIGAVNLLVDYGNYIVGENTEGEACAASLQKHGVEISGKNIVILGDGSNMRAICAEMVFMGAAQITLLGSPSEQTNVLLRKLSECEDVHAGFVEQKHKWTIPGDSDIVIVEVNPESDFESRRKLSIVLDSVKDSMFVQEICATLSETDFIREIRSRNIPCASGINVIIEQTARNVKRWSGVAPDAKAIYDALSF